MSDPSVTTGTTDERRPAADQKRSPLRRRLIWALAAVISYGLTLTLVSDTFFWFVIPGMLGLLTVVIIGEHAFLHRSFGRSDLPYAREGADHRGAVRYHVAILVGRAAVLVLTAGVMIIVPLIVKITYLYPFIGVGLMILVIWTRFWLPQMFWLWKCARILKVYDTFEFRAPVQKRNLHGYGKRFLIVGEGSPTMLAREPLCSNQWPKDIAEGVWFAGDEPFGGVLVVPGTGEMMCMQPQRWANQSKQRDQAGPERQEKAKRARLTGNSMYGP